MLYYEKGVLSFFLCYCKSSCGIRINIFTALVEGARKVEGYGQKGDVEK